MSDELPFLPPAGPRPIPDSILSLADPELKNRGRQLWEAANTMVVAIQEWCDWLRRLAKNEQATAFEAWNIRQSAASSLLRMNEAGLDAEHNILDLFPLPESAEAAALQDYDLDAAKARVDCLRQVQKWLQCFQQDLEVQPQAILETLNPEGQETVVYKSPTYHCQLTKDGKALIPLNEPPDTKPDRRKKKLPRSVTVRNLIYDLQDGLEKGKSRKEIACDFTGGDAKKADNLLRQTRRFKDLLD